MLARAGRPEVVLCAHLDTVPPFLPSRTDAEFVHGRGSCDAKGQAVCMLAAARALLAEGEDRVGFLFTVGEELDSAGARVADAALAEPWAPHHIVVGEPTGGRFVAAHKGAYKASLVAQGVAGHSSQDVGPSAIHELVGCVHRLLAQEWGRHPVLGTGSLNVGRIAGGVAPNVVAAEARAEVMIRTVEAPAAVEARLRSQLGQHVRLERAFKGYGPVEFEVPEGEPADAVAFGTDAPHLRRFGTPLLYGCGSILDAHTDHERVKIKDLEAAVDAYERMALRLLEKQ